MNTAIKQVETTGTLSAIDALEVLKLSIEAETDEFNELGEYCRKLESENTFIKLQLNNMESRLNQVIDENTQLLEARKKDELAAKKFQKQAEQVTENAQKHLQLVAQKDRELVQFKAQFDIQKATLDAYIEIANTPKKVREKIKDLKASNATKLGFINQHKEATKFKIKELNAAKQEIALLKRELQEVEFTQFYDNDGEILAVYPRLCEAGLEGELVKQIPIWYMNKGGSGALYMLNEDGEPQRSPLPKAGIKPKAETMRIIKTMLNKFKLNGNVVHADDFKILEVA